MSAFKKAVAADIHQVFLNLGEFAETHRLGDRDVTCIIDRNAIVENKDGGVEGVFLNSLTIYVEEAALSAVPVEGELLSVDGSFHFVRSVSREAGVLVIIAEANES